ncbi:histone-lysine N-methyltransferase SMYD1-like [Oppia nitens]|uniref:histone-lysine N-methyltransferase SMYD1-like n=1 Tax=Oppia nitens TaxID=1686743 RepID=UPI0023D9A6B2|nr:histone-lysine N-methyltransferase SMYD1-like [Oppia nitens]
MLKADKDYLTEDVVFECQPFVHHIYDRFKGQVCDHCLAKSDRLKKCANCGHMYYCNRNCQLNDWRSGHRYECQIFKNHYQKLLDEDNLAIPLTRLYLIIKADPHIVNKKYNTVDGHQLCFNDLQSHCHEISKDWLKMGVMTLISDAMKSCGIKVSKDYFRHLFGKFIVNYYELTYTNGMNQSTAPEKCGTGLFIGATALHHSCAYNVSVDTFVGNRLQVTARYLIRDGEVLTTYYVNPFNTKWFFITKGDI